MILPPLELFVTHDQLYRFSYLTETVPDCTNDRVVDFIDPFDPFVAIALQRDPTRGIKLIVEPT